ncbi:hypothetical protein NYZ99_17205 [Maribacter litopenaei]|uniref:Uncharacterized protein n=1 Tax=Maribacter litopenaei TaxID=2976127 RepID=A0ABY5Y6F0_9FLAO|nr:hypothetical protein [Maribacter litopenaei]UWX54593.1 hypothetical protein NYZ99_17205 [Maribacter litopenaei]
MKFKSKKDILFSILILGTNALLIGVTFAGIAKGEMEKDEYWVPVLILIHGHLSLLALFWNQL